MICYRCTYKGHRPHIICHPGALWIWLILNKQTERERASERERRERDYWDVTPGRYPSIYHTRGTKGARTVLRMIRPLTKHQPSPFLRFRHHRVIQLTCSYHIDSKYTADWVSRPEHCAYHTYDHTHPDRQSPVACMLPCHNRSLFNIFPWSEVSSV